MDQHQRNVAVVAVGVANRPAAQAGKTFRAVRIACVLGCGQRSSAWCPKVGVDRQSGLAACRTPTGSVFLICLKPVPYRVNCCTLHCSTAAGSMAKGEHPPSATRSKWRLEQVFVQVVNVVNDPTTPACNPSRPTETMKEQPMSPTIQNRHARTRDEGVCPSAGHAVHHLQQPLLCQPAGQRRVA